MSDTPSPKTGKLIEFPEDMAERMLLRWKWQQKKEEEKKAQSNKG